MLTLKHGTDDFGFQYGFIDVGGEAPARVDVMPPANLWRGRTRVMDLPHPALWVVFLDGEEIARVARQEEIGPLLAQAVEQLRVANAPTR